MMIAFKRGFVMLLALAGLWTAPAMAQLQTAAQGKDCPPTAQFDQAVFAKAAQMARNRGFLWRIERDGHASYLYGTLHVGKAEWMAAGPDLREALGAVDTVALEVDMTSEASKRLMQAVYSRPSRVVPEALRGRLARLWAAECLPAAQLGRGPVELQATALTVLQGRRQGFDPSYASERLLTMVASGRQLPLASLESLASQLDLLMAPSDAEAAELVSSMLDQLEKPQSRAMQQKLALAWERNDLALLADYQQWCDCVHTERERAAMRQLLDDRNPGLADGVERLHASGQRVLAAVGALHMTGPMALPRLMAARGFTVERLF